MMNCKNCKFKINAKDNYCKVCGAQIIRERITITSLFSNLLTALGWESKFFVTLRFLLFKPQVVVKGYINGTRKKYSNPFSFFAIILAISLLVFSKYSEQLFQMSTYPSLQQTEAKENRLPEDVKEINDFEFFGYKTLTEFQEGIMNFQLKYYNLLAFILLPLYTFITFFVFGKFYNFGEQLLINTYLQSITTLLGVLLFIFSLLSGLKIFDTGSVIISFLYYCFAYKSLYKLTFGQLLLKILKVIGILLLFFIIVVVTFVVVLKNGIII